MCIRDRPVADDPDTSAVQSDRMIPTGTVEEGAREALRTLKGGNVRMMQHSGRRDHHIGVILLAGADCEVPSSGGKFHAGDLASEADRREEVVSAGDSFDVRANLLPPRIDMTPLGIGREGVPVHVGRNITGDARVGILPPGPPDALPLLCLLYTSPSPRDVEESRMPSSA